MNARRERQGMSKKSCEAAESVEDAVLRMARVNSNYFKKTLNNSVNYGLSIPFFPVILFGT